MGKKLVLAGCVLLVLVTVVGFSTRGHRGSPAPTASVPLRSISGLGASAGRAASRAGQAADDSLSWHVLDAYTSRKIENEYLPSAADGTYVILNLAATNKGSKVVTLDGNRVKLQLDGSSYTPDAGGLSALELAGHKGLPGADVGPGATVSGWVVFDVPSHASTSAADLCLVQRAGSTVASPC